MMHQAAGDAWRDQEHRIAKRMLRGSHNSNDRLTDTIDELMGIFFAMPDQVEGDQGRRTFQMIEETRSEEHTSELQSLMRISYAVFCLKKKNNQQQHRQP